MPESEVKVKLKMPMIPLRDVVIFPNSVSTLFVGREKSIYSLLLSVYHISGIGNRNPRSKEKSAHLNSAGMHSTMGRL